MLRKYIASITTIVAFALIAGCGTVPNQQDTTLGKNWGRSFESAKYNQILDPDAGKNKKPVAGLDGQASEINSAKYREGFASETAPPSYNININDVGNVKGGM